MPYSIIGFVNDANMSGITESCVPTNHPEPTTHFHISTSRQTNLLPLSCRIAGSAILAHRRKAAATEPQFTIGEQDLRDAPLASTIYMA